MAGNEKRSIVLQERDRQLFQELATLRVADREQLKVVGEFGSVSRVNVRLLQLVRAGLLRRFFLGSGGAGRKALYALTPKAAQLVNVPLRGPRRKHGETLVADFFIEHQLEINRVYCTLKFNPIPVAGAFFRRWVTFTEPIAKAHKVIPDGYFELGTSNGVLSSFLELDLGHESLKVWKEKVRAYLSFAISGEYGRMFGEGRFRVAVIANSERRMQSIRSAIAPMSEKIFWFASLERIRKETLFGPVWLRPQGNRSQPFMENQ
jgi:hypothetical protein